MAKRACRGILRRIELTGIQGFSCRPGLLSLRPSGLQVSGIGPLLQDFACGYYSTLDSRSLNNQ